MSEEKNIWKSIGSILLVTNFENIEEIIQWREAFKNTGLNVHNCRILSIVGNKKERQSLSEMSNVTFVSGADFNFLGRLKNEDAKKLLSSKYDAILVVRNCSKKIIKAVNKVNCKLTIGLNTGQDDRMINLESVETAPVYLLSFVKRTLEKIS